ncbi:NAD-dependent epimerase/dehydratase family protein [Sporosarcina jeotgali]|uniref:UDP-glucose 4-epimerase n=1 Tax=Sporosarcina jeotgali TaxID=3020056 RepID=A0ABZ0KX03_9BACL|nr:NAD-dependent epimerase/dehydratase family protein [Sporosarcina sp. B2O-1]WOV84452.1 NAD-dependent epimerase/dehydratase family protein [Sporosarcina sp. B2O-1]
MRIAVTKGAGFIGSHLTTRLLELGPRVVVIDNLSNGKRKNLNPQSSLSVSVEDPLKDAAVYGVPVTLPISQEHALEPLSPYGLSKRTYRPNIRLTCAHHNLSHSILRYSNVYDPRQDRNSD